MMICTRLKTGRSKIKFSEVLYFTAFMYYHVYGILVRDGKDNAQP